MMVLKEPMVPQGLKVQQDHKAHKVQQETKVHREVKEI